MLQPHISTSQNKRQKITVIFLIYYNNISQEALSVLLPLMDWLESYKKEQAGNEAISNEVVASAHIENHAMKLFLYADKEDRESRFNKNVVKGGFIFHFCGKILLRKIKEVVEGAPLC